MESLRRAYATLDLLVSASPRDVRRQFKRLVRRWHPDRFARDPQGQAEAAARMREINAAYELLRDSYAPQPPSETPEGSMAAPVAPRERITRPLSRAAVDGIVRSIGTESPLGVLLGFLAWSWPLFLALLINPPRYQWLSDELAGRPHSSVLVWQLLLVALALVLRFWQRHRRLIG